MILKKSSLLWYVLRKLWDCGGITPVMQMLFFLVLLLHTQYLFWAFISQSHPRNNTWIEREVTHHHHGSETHKEIVSFLLPKKSFVSVFSFDWLQSHLPVFRQQTNIQFYSLLAYIIDYTREQQAFIAPIFSPFAFLITINISLRVQSAGAL